MARLAFGANMGNLGKPDSSPIGLHWRWRVQHLLSDVRPTAWRALAAPRVWPMRSRKCRRLTARPRILLHSHVGSFSFIWSEPHRDSSPRWPPASNGASSVGAMRLDHAMIPDRNQFARGGAVVFIGRLRNCSSALLKAARSGGSPRPRQQGPGAMKSSRADVFTVARGSHAPPVCARLPATADHSSSTSACNGVFVR